MAVAGSTLLKNCNMHVNATAYHLSLSWSGKVKHRFVNEINITLVSFLHPIPDQRQPWMLLVKNLSNSQSNFSGCIPVVMPCSDLENFYSYLNSMINN